MPPSGKVPGAEKGLVQVGRVDTHIVTSQAMLKQLPETPTYLPNPVSKHLSSIKLSKTLKLNELPGLHGIVPYAVFS